MRSKSSTINAPGIKTRKNKDGTLRLYWVARGDLVRRGYMPETVRLHYDLGNPLDHPLIEASCQRLQAEMLEWSSGRTRGPNSFNGTVKDLIRRYQVDPASPYQELKINSRRTYDEVMDKIERAFGARVLRNLTIADFRRWYDEAKKPKSPGGPERITKAHNIMRMVRRLLAYGVMAEIPECKRLHEVIAHARFKGAARNRNRLEFAHVRTFIDKAVEKGRLSLALATAIQFETAMRQKDVIGEWEPIQKSEPANGIVLNGRRWVRGLTWNDVSPDFEVRKQTTKTGAMVAVDLKLCPLVLEVLKHFKGDRIGPLIIDEKMKRPYAPHAFSREWRAIAKAAGIPDYLKNMQARAGAITEAEDAGADLDEIRSAVGHANAAMTARYSRGAMGKQRSVQTKRVALRTRIDGN
ncbi:MAG: tyrosine-type recombinase/integrase [Aestuariivirga sp.]|nr:tyrosine-type recombinase/integrase [Aestuariivirga sp.]